MQKMDFKIHYIRLHYIAAALRFPSRSVERKELWHKLRSRGNYNHNMTVMDVGKSELIVARKPNQISGHTFAAQDFRHVHTGGDSTAGRSCGSTRQLVV